MRAALPLVFFSEVNAPDSSRAIEAPSWNEGDYRGDLRDFRDINQCDSSQ